MPSLDSGSTDLVYDLPLMSVKRRARATIERTHLGRMYLQRRREARRPPCWARNQTDMEHMRVVIAASLRHDSNVVDVGAHNGEVLRLAVDRAPGGHHIAFEPLPDSAAALRGLFPTCTIHEVALANLTGTAQFHAVHGADAFSSLEGHSFEAERRGHDLLTVSVDRLDNLLPDGYRPTFVKIDVEGAEAEVLAGAVNTLRAHHPLLLIEHGGAGSGRPSTDRVFAILDDCGYELFDIDGGGPYSEARMQEVVESGTLWNWLAVPR